MEAKVERIDHLGLVAGVIKELKIVEMIDARIGIDPRENVTTGEAVAAMIINGLGFSNRPLTLTPQFFQSKAMSRLFRSEVDADYLNRFKLGRALDDCQVYGCEPLFAEISTAVCAQEGIDLRFNSLDTTTFSLTGEYDCDLDEHAIEITHGYSKDHRPDLKQAVLELVCSQDGSIPVISRAWNGNASDTKIFRERTQQLIQNFKEADTPRYLVADAKLYDAKTVDECLKHLPYITRIPGTINLERQTIEKAYKEPIGNWDSLDSKHHFRSFTLEHYGLSQRWIVVHSKEALSRAKKSVAKQCAKEKLGLEKVLTKLASQRFACEKDAQDALQKCGVKAKFHEVMLAGQTEHKVYTTRGRPTPTSPYEMKYQVTGKLLERKEAREKAIRQHSCYVIGTNIPKEELTDEEVIQGYKGQNSSVERGFRFLKDPLMFASSLFVKKPERIMALLMVMTLALLVYSVAQRRLRAALEEVGETLPSQIEKPTSRPTLRWVFQLLEGIEVVRIGINGKWEEMVSGLSALKKRIIGYFSEAIRQIYGLASMYRAKIA